MTAGESRKLVQLPVLIPIFLTIFLIGCTCSTAQEQPDNDRNVKKLVKANNILAMNIHRTLTKVSTDNLIFSPLSLSTAFAMLFYGTRGFTARELGRTLGYEAADLNSNQVHTSFQQLLTSIGSPSDDAYVLNLANLILVDEKYGLLLSYRDNVQRIYGATVRDVDFQRDTRNIQNFVNDWVKTETKGKIDGVIEDLDPSTILLIINAVYFKGTWMTQFNPQKTRPRQFYNDGQDTGAKFVPMMNTISYFQYMTHSDYAALELPYKGQDKSMLILLPNSRNGLKALEKSINPDTLNTIRNELSPSKVNVFLPKFKIEFFKELSQEFMSLGANTIFQRNADFSCMTSQRDIFVNQVLHKAVIEVNEKGSVAAAVIVIAVGRGRPTGDPKPIFNANHPFLFYILDSRSGLILFHGRVNKL